MQGSLSYWMQDTLCSSIADLFLLLPRIVNFQTPPGSHTWYLAWTWQCIVCDWCGCHAVFESTAVLGSYNNKRLGNCQFWKCSSSDPFLSSISFVFFLFVYKSETHGSSLYISFVGLSKRIYLHASYTVVVVASDVWDSWFALKTSAFLCFSSAHFFICLLSALWALCLFFCRLWFPSLYPMLFPHV